MRVELESVEQGSDVMLASSSFVRCGFKPVSYSDHQTITCTLELIKITTSLVFLHMGDDSADSPTIDKDLCTSIV